MEAEGRQGGKAGWGGGRGQTEGLPAHACTCMPVVSTVEHNAACRPCNVQVTDAAAGHAPSPGYATLAHVTRCSNGTIHSRQAPLH